MAAVLLIAAQVAGAQVGPAGAVRPAGVVATDVRRIAILPVENLSGVRAPLTDIAALLTEGIRNGGFVPVAEPSLAAFMKAHRLRYTGGVSLEIARAGREEVGAEAILVTSLETFREGPVPRATLHSRLVSTGDDPQLLWADSVGLAGDDAPGLLALGLITEPRPLLEKAAGRLAQSLVAASREWRRAGRVTATAGFVRVAARYRPRTRFRAAALNPGARHTVAVIPFLNVSERKYADKILALHFVNELRRHPNLTVVEPGMVRERLLATRAIMAGGPSLAVADLFFHQEFPAVDLILSGEVFDYQDRERVPKVDFSLQVFEKTTREVVWFSRSYNRGDEHVLFFDLGRQRTAHGLVTRMVRSVVDRMLR